MAVYQIKPVPKPRMTQSDKWKKRPAVVKYWSFVDEVQHRCVELHAGDSIIFTMPMPKSWSAKKKREMVGTPHLFRPDLSNLLKALEDAVHQEDSMLWWYKDIKKVWGVTGTIEVK